MSSNDTTPYTIPYTGALGKQIAQGVVPASSLEPGAVAQPPAPQDQDKQQQGYQRPSVANGLSSPETSHAKGETLTMAGDGGCAATSDANSAARRSSVALTTHSGPSDSVPLRFASAAAGVGGIAIIHPEHRNSQGVHSSSTSKQDAVNQDEGSTTFSLDGQLEDSEDLMNSPTQNPARMRADRQMLARELQAVHQENKSLKQTNQDLRTQSHFYKNAADMFYSGWVHSIEDVKDLQTDKERSTRLILRLHSLINRIDSELYCRLPEDVQNAMEDVREQWKYSEWLKAFHPQANSIRAPIAPVVANETTETPLTPKTPETTKTTEDDDLSI